MVPEIIDMELPIEGVFHNMALVKIHKEYPGQALKVMNTLWGAGQMMFTKMIVIVDQHAPPLSDYPALAKYVSENTDPERDIVISKGPIDVLDHSCSSMAFGGKLGIDASRKHEEESLSRPAPPNPATGPIPQLASLQAAHPEITDINTRLLLAGISLAFIALRKAEKGHVKRLARQLVQRDDFRNVRCLIFLDHTVDVQETADAVWRFANNTDVKRDILIFEYDDASGQSRIALDGTMKTLEFDNFTRPWPEILVMADDVVNRIDAIWPTLGLGELLTSPSRKYKQQVYGNEAVVKQ
jgi:4-hydroxy-3-polyprenylbenzoate decarboxylase